MKNFLKQQQNAWITLVLCIVFYTENDCRGKIINVKHYFMSLNNEKKTIKWWMPHMRHFKKKHNAPLFIIMLFCSNLCCQRASRLQAFCNSINCGDCSLLDCKQAIFGSEKHSVLISYLFCIRSHTFWSLICEPSACFTFHMLWKC